MLLRSASRPYLPSLVFLLVFAAAAPAALPTFWTLESQSDFLNGEIQGLSIASDGAISLAPDTRNLYEATDPFFWSLVSDGSGNLYAGSGNDGKVYKIDASGNATVIADTNELEVHSLAIDRQGTVYAGTSPRGAVYKIGADGAQEVLFDPDERYIWALALDSTGNLLVATGDKGNLYRLTSGGQSELLFSSQETHLVCLATDGDGNVYAGSDSNGLVFRIDRNGKASVLFDTPFQEVHALVVDSRGNVYAAAVNGDKGSAPSTPVLPSPVQPSTLVEAPSGGLTESVTVTVSSAQVLSPAPPTPATTSAGLAGALYRISPEGATEKIWESSQDLPLSLKLERDDRIMVGTGKDGRIFLVRQDKTSSLLARVESDQVTSIYSPDPSSVFFTTANPARVYRLTTGRRTEGIYHSPIKDTNAVSSMGKIRWEARVPAGTSLLLQTRTGNSAKPDNTWSDWSPSYSVSTGDQITSPRGRFLQWRATFRSPDGNGTPELVNVTVVYLQRNLGPSISEITLHPPGETFQKPLVATGLTEIMGLDSPIETPEMSPRMLGQSSSITTAPTVLPPTAYSRKIYQKGYQTVTWSADDPNEDKLSYDVYYRGEGETLWKLLREDLSEEVVAWDTVAMPDGRYTLKIVASDAPSNPTETALTGEKESRSFEVDNTPPRVNGIQATQAQSGHRVTFQAEDDTSAVRKVEYSVDSGNWHVVYPTDGICDSRQESFDFVLEAYTQGVHTLVVKVTDLLNNVATARLELR